jgi:hypothetical protein
MADLKPMNVLGYLNEKYGEATIKKIFPLGAGAHGEGYRVEFSADGVDKAVIVKTLFSDGFGHDYPSDRAQVFIQAHLAYNKMKNHVHSLDVVGMGPNGLASLGESEEYFIVMEEAPGKPYFDDLERVRETGVTEEDRAKVEKLADFLAEIHASKIDNPSLYRRKIRDTVGHGECLMGVFDTYPPTHFTSEIELVQITMKAVKWWGRIKDMGHRLSTVHGDFHPGNIYWDDEAFVLLDRSRGLYGDPADDLSALAINYIFYDLQGTPDFSGPYRELFDLFFERYLSWTHDDEVFQTIAPFFAFRAAVVANPALYPDVDDSVRRKLFNFAQNVLDTDVFDWKNVSAYFTRM